MLGWHTFESCTGPRSTSSLLDLLLRFFFSLLLSFFFFGFSPLPSALSFLGLRCFLGSRRASPLPLLLAPADLKARCQSYAGIRGEANVKGI